MFIRMEQLLNQIYKGNGVEESSLQMFDCGKMGVKKLKYFPFPCI
jgi:hypothetical protein